MNGETYELAIIAFIVIMMGVAIWRGGAQNPVSTGSLNRKVGRMANDLSSIKSEFEGIDKRVTEIERRGATSDDIRGIERKLEEHYRCLAQLDSRLDGLNESTAAKHASIDHTMRQVDRLYDHIVSKGMNA